MNSTEWYFPQDFEEAKHLSEMKAVFFHSGGTAISPQMINKKQHIVDTRNLPIHQLKIDNGFIYLGAGLTFNNVVEKLNAERPGHLLVKALVNSSSAPLRNRITLGGSVAAFPSWSDLMGPLIALNANIYFSGSKKNPISIFNYIKERETYKKLLITGIAIEDVENHTYYHRETRVQFDYPAFTISIVTQFNKHICIKAKIVIIGTRNKYSVLDKLSKQLAGKSGEQILTTDVDAFADLKFNKKEIGSGEYVAKIALHRIKQGLCKIAGEVK